ncbi:MAG: N-acetylmuramic acid 6-phosphate etherase [Ginsengibacter sp.]
MAFINITEQTSRHRYLEKMSISQILSGINNEDKTVALAVEQALPQIEKLVEAVADKMLAGGRLFYIGAGTSGRLGILDASECPPTYGVPAELVRGIIAGGKKAITSAVESAEDDAKQGWQDLKDQKVSPADIVIGIASSGTTPYVIGALKKCKKKGILTGSIACNPGSPMSDYSDFPVEVIVGPEFITGSTRMKSGTAQKMVLNMISTTVMIQLGRVEDNKMVHMRLSNYKLVKRGTQMVMEKTGIGDKNTAKALLLKYGSVKKAVEKYQQQLLDINI